jgi:hypothetical protein
MKRQNGDVNPSTVDGQKAQLDEQSKKRSARSNAEDVIYSAISDWIGEKVTVDSPIPIYREGKRVGEFDATMLGKNFTVGKIIDSADELNIRELQTKITDFEKIASMAEALNHALEKLEITDFHALDFGYGETFSHDVDERVIKAIGRSQATLISSKLLASSLHREIDQMKKEFEQRGSRVGRPRDEAAYRVALGFAQLYAKVTGNFPKYSENRNGLSGPFTPRLRDVFVALGWEDRTLRGPAEKACGQITDADFEYARTRQSLGILGGVKF